MIAGEPSGATVASHSQSLSLQSGELQSDPLVGLGDAYVARRRVATKELGACSQRRNQPRRERLGNHRRSQPQLRNLANLEPDSIVEEKVVKDSLSEPQTPRKLTPPQLAFWELV